MSFIHFEYNTDCDCIYCCSGNMAPLSYLEEVHLADQKTEVAVELHSSLSVICTFNYWQTQWEFKITAWTPAGLSNLLRFFHAYRKRDPSQYGEFDGSTSSLKLCADVRKKKRNIVKVAIRDVFHIVHSILLNHRLNILAYSAWYLRRYLKKNPKDYGEYISKITCECILDNTFLGPESFEVVQFDDLALPFKKEE